MVEKENLGQIFKITLKNFCVGHRKLPVIHFPYIKIVRKAFFFKMSFFCHQSVQLFSKNIRNGLIFFLLFFENVWKLYDKHFLHTLDVKACHVVIKACINTTYKRNRNSQRFWNKNFKWKEKKANIIVSRTTLCIQKIKFWVIKVMHTKNSICGWKKIWWQIFKIT